MRPKTLWHASARLSLALALASLAGIVSARQTAPPPLHFYTLGTPVMTAEKARPAADFLGLTTANGSQFNGGVFMGDGSVRGIFKGDGNAYMYVAPDLTKADGPAPATADTRTMASNFASQFGLFTPEHFQAEDATFFTKNSSSLTGGDGKPTDVLRGIRFRRYADGLPVYGPTSDLTFDVGPNGVAGFTNTLRPLVKSEAAPRLKSDNQINLEFQMKMNRQANGDGALPRLMSKRLIYFEQGLKWVQPVWLFSVRFTPPAGTNGAPGAPYANFVLVPAVQNSPEIMLPEFPALVSQPIFPDAATTAQPEAFNLESLYATTAAAQASPVRVGEYIVREDDAGWLNDANGFWSSLVLTNGLTSFIHPGVTRVDYWWNQPWCWYPALGIADNSPYFVGKDHFALIEGHGAPWEITTYKNYGDFIYLDLINGYGTNQVSGEQTAYVMWQSCDVVPQPGHPYEARFTSPKSAFDVWWKIFKGMRGNFGYRTLMHIWNGVGAQYGFREGLGVHNVAGWLDATDHGVFGHLDGLDYGSCVIVSGHENDTFYNNSQLPNPNSLTMWWIHA